MGVHVAPGLGRVEQGANVELLLVGGERGRPQAGDVRRHLGQPIAGAAAELVARGADAVVGFAGVEEPSARRPLGAASQVAAGKREGGPTRRGEDGQKGAMVVVHGLGSGREVGGGEDPDAVGQQGVVAAASGERSFGHAHHDHPVELDPDRHRRRTDQHAVAEGSVAGEIVVAELEFEGPTERGHGGGRIDAIEIAEPVDRCVDALGRSQFVGGPAVA